MNKRVYYLLIGRGLGIRGWLLIFLLRGQSAMDAASSSGTNQELTLDHSSFEKLLSAAWVLQCLNDQLHPSVQNGKAVAQAVVAQKQITIASSGKPKIIKPDVVKQEITKPTVQTSRFVIDSKSVLPNACSADDGIVTELVKTQEAIETGMLQLDATVRRLVSLSPKPAHESAEDEPVVSELTPFKLMPLEVKLTLPARPTPGTEPVKRSSVRQNALDNNRLAPQASAFNLKISLNRMRGVLAQQVSTLRANSTLRLRAVTAAAGVKFRTTHNRLRDTVGGYRATFRARTEKEPTSRGPSFNLVTALRRLRDACTLHTTTFRINLNLRSLRAVAIATPIWLLVVIANLLLLETWLHQPFKDAPAMLASSSSTVQASINTPARSSGPLSQPTKKIDSTEPRQSVSIPAFAASHDQITDAATSSVVAQLIRFEINGLRRQAKYGDDSAAFTLGMAYEVGRYVRQNCTEAARWVTTAAAAGNPAAEYNLGLRYRDGDGVSADLHESEKWLRKAAAHRNRNAKLALQLLASR
jgi:hypothetical protein